MLEGGYAETATPGFKPGTPGYTPVDTNEPSGQAVKSILTSTQDRIPVNIKEM